MKKLLSLFALLLSGIAAAAGPNPHFEPGPIMKMEEGAVDIASILLNKQLTTCVTEFQKQSPITTEITVQRYSPTSANYVIKGNLLLGGDILTGPVFLTIQESRVPAMMGFGTLPVYNCKVDQAAYDRVPQAQPEQE